MLPKFLVFNKQSFIEGLFRYSIMIWLIFFPYLESVAISLVTIEENSLAKQVGKGEIDFTSDLPNQKMYKKFSYFRYPHPGEQVTVYLTDSSVLKEVKIKVNSYGVIYMKYKRNSRNIKEIVGLQQIKKIVDANGKIIFPLEPGEQELYDGKTKNMAVISLLSSIVAAGLVVPLFTFYTAPLIVSTIIVGFVGKKMGKDAIKRYAFQKNKKGRTLAFIGAYLGALAYSCGLLIGLGALMFEYGI